MVIVILYLSLIDARSFQVSYAKLNIYTHQKKTFSSILNSKSKETYEKKGQLTYEKADIIVH